MKQMKNSTARSLSLIYALTALLFSTIAWAAEPANFQHTAQTIIHSLDYVSVDYPGAFENGKVTKQSEFDEQLEIATHALNLAIR